MYLVLSAFISSPISLAATTKASTFSFTVCTLPPNILTSAAYINTTSDNSVEFHRATLTIVRSLKSTDLIKMLHNLIHVVNSQISSSLTSRCHKGGNHTNASFIKELSLPASNEEIINRCRYKALKQSASPQSFHEHLTYREDI